MKQTNKIDRTEEIFIVEDGEIETLNYFEAVMGCLDDIRTPQGSGTPIRIYENFSSVEGDKTINNDGFSVVEWQITNQGLKQVVVSTHGKYEEAEEALFHRTENCYFEDAFFDKTFFNSREEAEKFIDEEEC